MSKRNWERRYTAEEERNQEEPGPSSAPVPPPATAHPASSASSSSLLPSTSAGRPLRTKRKPRTEDTDEEVKKRRKSRKPAEAPQETSDAQEPEKPSKSGGRKKRRSYASDPTYRPRRTINMPARKSQRRKQGTDSDLQSKEPITNEDQPSTSFGHGGFEDEADSSDDTTPYYEPTAVHHSNHPPLTNDLHVTPLQSSFLISNLINHSSTISSPSTSHSLPSSSMTTTLGFDRFNYIDQPEHELNFYSMPQTGATAESNRDGVIPNRNLEEFSSHIEDFDRQSEERVVENEENVVTLQDVDPLNEEQNGLGAQSPPPSTPWSSIGLTESEYRRFYWYIEDLLFNQDSTTRHETFINEFIPWATKKEIATTSGLLEGKYEEDTDGPDMSSSVNRNQTELDKMWMFHMIAAAAQKKDSSRNNKLDETELKAIAERVKVVINKFLVRVWKKKCADTEMAYSEDWRENLTPISHHDIFEEYRTHTSHLGSLIRHYKNKLRDLMAKTAMLSLPAIRIKSNGTLYGNFFKHISEQQYETTTTCIDNVSIENGVFTPKSWSGKYLEAFHHVLACPPLESNVILLLDYMARIIINKRICYF